MSVEKLPKEAINSKIADLPDWELRDEKLYRKFEFSDFVQAFGFMAKAAIVSEKMNHHPEWSNVYKTVEVSLSTHDVGGISEKDFEWAASVNKLV